MNLRRSLILACMLAALRVLAVGQDQTSQGQASPEQVSPEQGSPSQSPSSQAPQNPSSGQVAGDAAASSRTAPVAPLSGIVGIEGAATTEDTNSNLPQIPALLGGQGTATPLLSAMERSNFLRGGVNVGAAYDDNPLLLSSGAIGNGSVSVFPNISIEQTSSRMRWLLGYAGGLTVNQRFSSQDQGSQNVNFDSEFRLTPHVNLRVAENFSDITGFFDDSGNGSESVVSAGLPNASLIAPLATERSSLTTVETNYHFALHDLLGASGSFYDLHFTNVPVQTGLAAPLLPNSETETGTGFWLHQMFNGDWLGTSYRFERLTFTGGEESLVHSFFVVDTLKFSQHFKLSAFAGPQYSNNQGLVTSGSATALVETNNWSVAGGIDGGWQDQRTGVFAGFSRSISDGGGVLGAVLLQTVHGNFRRQLMPGWAVSLTGSHGSNQSITPGIAASAINLTSAGISLERNVGKSVGFHMGYSHDFQQQYFGPSSALPGVDASKNRVFVTLSYQWAKPLGM